MRITSKIAVAAMAAGLAFGATAANAAVVVDGATTVSVTGPTGNEYDFSLGLSDSGTNSPFTELLRFSNTLAGFYDISLTTSDKDVNFTSALLTGTGIVGSISLDSLFDNGIIELIGKDSISLGAGTFDLTIKGTRQTGSFGGTLAFNAVPEPSTWAMMILGLGFAGAAMRRRQQTVRYNFA